MTENDSGYKGCPVCDWDGKVAQTYDSTHRYYTHVAVQDGETFFGKTCSMRTSPKPPSSSLWSRLVSWATRDYSRNPK